jgi:hypothetical protein
MIRTPDVAVTVTDGLLWLLNAADGTPVLSYEVNRNKARRTHSKTGKSNTDTRTPAAQPGAWHQG